MSDAEKKTEEAAEKICRELGLYVYETEYKKEGSENVLRVYIDSDSGVTIDDCEKVSRALSDVLDRIDPIKGPYELEVSSPGIERELKRDWHFKKARGSKITAKLFGAVDGEKSITGILKGSDEKSFTIEKEDKTEVIIEKEKAATVKTVFEF